MHKLLSLGFLLFAVAPTSTNYILKTYDSGSGGTSSSSTNYKLNGVAGSQSGNSQSSSNYKVSGGENSTLNSNVTPAPTFTNPSSYYDRLKLVLNTGNNASDTKFLIAISSDGFVSTKYVQADNTIGTSQSIANYQTYSAWGGASGFLILGLSPSTNYQVKVKALQGGFTGSAFGPTASAATVATSLTFSLTTTLTASPPFPVSFSSLTPGSVVSGDADALISLSSNALNGGAVYLSSSNAGLTSVLASTTISSATTNLAATATGYGVQVTNTSQVSGGPLTSQSPFNGTSDNIGGLNSALQSILSTSSSITTGSATVRLKAKASVITPSANDYADSITFIAAMQY